MGFLIDTSVLIDLERGARSIEPHLQSVTVFLAAVSASELLHAVHRANTAARRARREAFVENILRTLPILDFDLSVARVYAQIWADLRAAGFTLGAHDLQIAATAVRYDLTILTANIRDFSRVESLRIQTLEEF